MSRSLHWLLYSSLLPILFHLIFRVKIFGRHHIPRSGRLIVAANHASYLDPPILAYTVARPISFLAKFRLFQFPLLGLLLKLTGCEPVRDHGLQPSLLRRATRRLLHGTVVAVFPTGTRTHSGDMSDAKDGVSYLSHITQTPVLPIAIVGTNVVLPKGRFLPKIIPIEVRVAEIIQPPQNLDRASLKQHTALICNVISRMLNQ